MALGQRARSVEGSGVSTPPELIEATLRPSWSVRPSLDQALNDHLSLGAELGIGWLGVDDQEEASAPRRLTLTPQLRFRMDFPLSCAWVMEGLLAAGVSTWSAAQGVPNSQGGARAWGFSYRMSLGLRYLINTKVHALIALGYTQQELYSDEVTLSLSASPLTIGLRSAF